MPIANPKPPDCARTPCGSPEKRPRIKSWWKRLFEMYQLARRLNQPLFSGGLMQQEAQLVEMLLIIDRILAEAEAASIKRSLRTKPNAR